MARAQETVMNTRVLTLGFVVVALGLALLLPDPSTCARTLIGVPPGAPDINTTFCDGYFAQQLGSNKGFEGGADVLLPALQGRAAWVAAVTAVVFVVAALSMRRRTLMSWRVVAVLSTLLIALTGLNLVWRDQGWFMNLDATTSDSG
jgi:hypothetical protein